jgi:dienelactone hydrolase
VLSRVTVSTVFFVAAAFDGGGAASASPRPPGAPGDPLPGTRPLDLTGDIASHLVDGVDRFLLDEIAKSAARRAAYWKRDFSSPEAYTASLEPNRRRLAHILGVRDPRVPFDGPELVATTARSALVGRGDGYEVFAVRWPAFAEVHGEGLLLVPSERPLANVVAVPDADQTPEQLCGLAEGLAAESQIARRLAECGARVLVPVLVSRELAPRNGRAVMTNREFVYRSAYELGRHLIGYEVAKVLAGVDWFATAGGPIGVVGYGEGGLIALCAAALDPRIETAVVSGFFGPREGVWQEPIDRNVFGLLREFGGAELASMVAPRTLRLEAARGPELELAPGKGGAPARLASPRFEDVRRELERAKALAGRFGDRIDLSHDGGALYETFGTDQSLQVLVPKMRASGKRPVRIGEPPDALSRQDRQVRELDRHNQWLLGESPYVRAEFLRKLDTGTLERYAESVEPYRRFFYDEVIGRFEHELLPPDPRSRQTYDEASWRGYEVVLDVFPGVVAYGILLVPKDLAPGERRPVVVCQHGLEGRPQHTIAGEGEDGYGPYKAFAARLAERGFVTFAPQNLYIFGDRFRTLQRKANPLGKTLFSVIVPQHQQIVDWLQTLPFVDPERIGFYGLSYGGKTAMRVPALVTDYKLSICSADFNEWVWKNASTRSPYSYVWTGEYEIFEFDLGSTFNYAEMAALIAPRPFMVERGHFDGVAPDETVGYEFAKVRHLYAARLKVPERCEIEWFDGPHTINGKGTFAFLHRHLGWRERE